MQEIALSGLARAGFFNHAAFYGGTALRIFYQLPRYSEDLDFSLLIKDPSFKMLPFLEGMESEFAALDLRVRVSEKVKSKASAIDSAFLKSETSWSELNFIVEGSDLNLNNERINIKIKLEVDTLPPLGFACESKLLLRPYSLYVNVMELPDLYAGKMHALLFRNWKKRVKGRDWFDFEWYVQRGEKMRLAHFEARALESGDWGGAAGGSAAGGGAAGGGAANGAAGTMTLEHVRDFLHRKIDDLDFAMAKEDALRFIPPADAYKLDIWSADYFRELVKRVKVI
jgi:predicted nucleotidyltransferase component of viral defense system